MLRPATAGTARLVHLERDLPLGRDEKDGRVRADLAAHRAIDAQLFDHDHRLVLGRHQSAVGITNPGTGSVGVSTVTGPMLWPLAVASGAAARDFKTGANKCSSLTSSDFAKLSRNRIVSVLTMWHAQRASACTSDVWPYLSTTYSPIFMCSVSSIVCAPNVPATSGWWMTWPADSNHGISGASLAR